jgi:hypothetical protein
LLCLEEEPSDSNPFHEEETIEETDLEVELNVGQDAEMKDLMSAEEMTDLMAFEYLLDEESEVEN